MYEHVCMYVYACIPTTNQTNRYVLYLLNTDDINYTIKTLSVCMYVCIYVCIPFPPSILPSGMAHPTTADLEKYLLKFN